MITRIYRKRGEYMTPVADKPLLLFVTTERTARGLYVKIKGCLNPLPFKEATIHKTGKELEGWLINRGWVEVGHYYE